MQQQMRLRRWGRSGRGCGRGGLVTALVMAGVLLGVVSASGRVVAAEAGGDQAQMAVAQQKKADELLAVAKAQLGRKEYEPCRQTLAECEALQSSLTASQQKKLQQLRQEGEQGEVGQQQAQAALTAGSTALEAGRLAEARSQLERARAQKKYLPEATVKKIEEQLAVVAEQQKRQKAALVQLFKQSVQDYRQGRLPEARAGFQKVQESGVEPGLFERGGGFTDTAGYLRSIDAKLAGQAKAAPAASAEVKESGAGGAAQGERAAVEPGKAGPGPVQPAGAGQQVMTEVAGEAQGPAASAELAQAVQPEPAATSAAPAATEPQKEQAQTAPKEQKAAPKKSQGFWLFGRRQKTIPPETQQKIDGLLAQGNQAMDRRNYALAKEYFNQVLQLNPQQEEAERGVAAADYNLQRPKAAESAARPSLLTLVDQQEQVQRQYVQATFADANDRIAELLAKNQFEEARTRVNQVLAALDAYKQLLGPEEYGRMRTAAQGLLRQVADQQQTYEQQTLKEKREKAQEEEMLRQRNQERARQEKINDLFERAQRFKESHEYDQAVATLNHLLELDPQHPGALLLKEYMEMMQFMTRQADIERQVNYEETKALTDVGQAAIPWSDVMTYPGQPEVEPQLNWKELTERRRRATLGPAGVDAQVYDRLDTAAVSLDYTETEFEQVLADLQSNQNLNINVLWGSLQTTAGIERTARVTLLLKNVPLGKALDSLLDYVSSGRYGRAAYTVDNGVITVGAEADLPQKFYVQAYYVADLVSPRSQGWGMFMGSAGGGGGGMGGGGMTGGGGMYGGGGGGGRMGGGGGGGMYGGGGGGGMYGGGGGMTGGDVYSQIYSLTYLMQTAVGYDQWDYGQGLQQGVGGPQGQLGAPAPGAGPYGTTTAARLGTIEVYGVNTLVVRQTRKNHRIIEDLLKELRRTLGEQVQIESRFLVISSNFLEDIGLDVDFFLNLGNAGYDQTGTTDPVTGRQILTPRTSPGPWNRTTPMSVSQNSWDFTSPGSTSVPGSLGGGGTPTAFQMGGSFLDNVQVDFLMRATKAHQRSMALAAPHVTVFSGDTARVEFYVSQPYVASVTAQTGTHVGLYQPQMNLATTGVTLYVSPTISADKRYVLLNVEAQQNQLIRMETFTFNEAGGTTPVSTDQGTGLTTPTSTASTGRVQEPVQQTNAVQTRVQVPDGGTLLLGGQKLAGEIEKEMGVPALSNISILNRLFTNRGSSKDESILLILVKPKIILPEEEEDRRFGSLTEPTGQK